MNVAINNNCDGIDALVIQMPIKRIMSKSEVIQLLQMIPLNSFNGF